jgi:HEAT repeat protein
MSIFDKIFKKKKEIGQKIQRSPELYVPGFDRYDKLGDINSIFDFVLNSDIKIASKAANTIQKIFGEVQVFKNNQLYESFKYLRINKSDINTFDRFDKEIRITLLCIASMNGDGHSREEALNRLIKVKSQRTIPFIIFRLADWVTPIRKKAENAIKSLLVEENTILLIQNHKLIDWLLSIKKTDLSDLYYQIVSSITSKRIDSSQLKKLNEGERYFYFKSFVNLGELDSELISQMLNDKYYLIRILLIKYFDKVDNCKIILSKLLSDRSQKVRIGAIRLISNKNIKDYQPILESLIFDNSTSVRLEARHLLSKICDLDFKTKYKENIYNKHFLVGSILGLSEVSDINEISTIHKFLDSDILKVRIAALFGIYNLDSELATVKAYQFLEKENSASLKKAAETILLKQNIDIERLRNIYDLSDITGKKIILRLFNRHGCWSVAGDFLKALNEDNEKLQLLARIFLESWDKYTIRLATSQSHEDKDYVLNWYEKIKRLGIDVPENIPFIFGEK